ncbi:MULTISPECIES: LacI family DNA-binding transcriptional regulator [Sphingomonas]|uniref:LacI family DNA-binding transcriptional regulator n=1 Tax=Sphingomonas TaxID=13687 RepID=UPI000DEEFED9|nr:MULTISPECIES: LacI family DNA-binding transcriptional regulator [Sphingomonas]
MGRRRQAVTIKHVAADAGVSLQTVSRVINNEAGVRPEMKQRVQEAIDRLHYVPSIAAQRLSGSRSYLILALNDRDRTIADWRSREGRDWVDQMLLGGMTAAAGAGYRLLLELVDTHNDHVERELRSTIAALQPDGVILTPPHSDNPLITHLLDEQRISFARIGSTDTDTGLALLMDEEGAAALATRHLLDLGHRRIGFIAGSPEYSLSARRVEGWRRAMEAVGGADDALLAEGDFSYASGEQAATQLLDLAHPPTAIIASNDQMALATLAVAQERGLSIPAQLSLISFDNTPVVRFVQPPLTAIDQPIAEIAAKAVELIVADQHRSDRPSAPLVIAAALVERDSTAAPADPGV